MREQHYTPAFGSINDGIQPRYFAVVVFLIQIVILVGGIEAEDNPVVVLISETARFLLERLLLYHLPIGTSARVHFVIAVQRSMQRIGTFGPQLGKTIAKLALRSRIVYIAKVEDDIDVASLLDMLGNLRGAIETSARVAEHGDLARIAELLHLFGLRRRILPGEFVLGVLQHVPGGGCPAEPVVSVELGFSLAGGQWLRRRRVLCKQTLQKRSELVLRRRHHGRVLFCFANRCDGPRKLSKKLRLLDIWEALHASGALINGFRHFQPEPVDFSCCGDDLFV